MRRLLALTALATLALLAGPARADGDADAAKKHFEQGRKLRDEGDCTKAIAEFQASIAADKSIGAYYNMGFCQEQLQRRQDAYANYKAARDMASARNDPRLNEISGALAALMNTPNIRLALPQLPPGIQIFVDGELVPPALYSTETIFFTKARPTHDVKVITPGYQDVNVKVETQALKAIDLKPAEPAAATTQPATTPPPPPDTRIHVTGQHIGGAAAIVGGVALDAIGIAVIATYLTQHSRLKDEADTAFQKGRCSNATGQLVCASDSDAATYNTKRDAFNDTSNRWNSIGWLAIGSTVLGTLAVAGGVYLLVTAPPLSEPVERTEKPAAKLKPVILPTVSPTFQGLSLSGTF